MIKRNYLNSPEQKKLTVRKYRCIRVQVRAHEEKKNHIQVLFVYIILFFSCCILRDSAARYR